MLYPDSECPSIIWHYYMDYNSYKDYKYTIIRLSVVCTRLCDLALSKMLQMGRVQQLTILVRGLRKSNFPS